MPTTPAGGPLGDATADGRLPPYIRAPNGQMERATMKTEVDKEEWRRGFYNFANEIYDPGPDAFWRVSDFEAWLATQLGGRQTSIAAEAGSFQVTPGSSTLVAPPTAVAGAVESPALPAESSETARKLAFVKQVADEIWGGPPPAHLTSAKAVQLVGARLKADHDMSDTEIDSLRTTILRAIGRRKK
jgi:hypothetical protein